MAIEKPKLEIGTNAGYMGTVVDVRAKYQYLMEHPSGERRWCGDEQELYHARETTKSKARSKRATKGRKFTGLDATSAKIAAMAEARGDHETAAKIRENVAGT